MQIIPAVDIADKKVVRLEQGRFDKEKIYSESPLLVAKGWKEAGAKLLHVVDLDGSRLGKPVNLEVVEEMIKTAAVDVELGGGLRSEEDIKNAFRAGVRFAVIGTSAVLDEEFCSRAIEEFGEKIIFAVDCRDGKVAIRGWKEFSGEDPKEYIGKLERLGAKKIIYTDISKDGMMSGPNIDMLKDILGSTSMEVIASGGISSLDDIKTLRNLEKDGLTGVILGKALYEGKINLKEALNVG